MLAVGGQSNKVPPGQMQHPTNGKAEHFDDQEKKWTSVDSWPYSVQRSNLKSTFTLGNYFTTNVFDLKSDWTAYHASVFLFDSFYIVGGKESGKDKNSLIARLDAASWKWLKAGKMAVARVDYSVTWVNSKLAIIGGHKYSEVCELQERSFTCKVKIGIETGSDQAGKVKYLKLPLIFVVDNDYNAC